MGPGRQKRCVGWPEAAFRLVSGWTLLKVRMKLEAMELHEEMWSATCETIEPHKKIMTIVIQQVVAG